MPLPLCGRPGRWAWSWRGESIVIRSVRYLHLRRQFLATEQWSNQAVERVRPKMMTVAAAMMGLMPIMWSTGAGADVMKRVAAPMVGGLATSFLMELLVCPAIYLLWKRRAQVERPAKAARLPQTCPSW